MTCAYKLKIDRKSDIQDAMLSCLRMIFLEILLIMKRTSLVWKKISKRLVLRAVGRSVLKPWSEEIALVQKRTRYSRLVISVGLDQF